MKVKIVSLYDGMSCGMIAFRQLAEELNLEIERYVSWEYDETSANEKKGRPYGWAAYNTSQMFPEVEQHGDVFNADFTKYQGFDFVLAGFPCQKFSISQKHDRETKPYSGIGWDMFAKAWEAVCVVKPRYFLFENNESMAKPVQNEISKIVGFEPYHINSALVSAQNRQRIYWVGKRNADGTYNKVNVEQPTDRGILLKDVLDGASGREKARCVTASVGRTTYREYFEKCQNTIAFEPVVAFQDKSYCITSNEWKGSSVEHSLKKHVRTKVAELVYLDGDSEYCKIHAISAKCDANNKKYTVYQVENGQITIKEKQYPIKLADGFYIIRKLTVNECRRLQTIPDWFHFFVSDSQAYRMLGNGWTVEVIMHLIRSCYQDDTAKHEIFNADDSVQISMEL